MSGDTAGFSVESENMPTTREKKSIKSISDCTGFVVPFKNVAGIYSHSWMERPCVLLHTWFIGIYTTYAA